MTKDIFILSPADRVKESGDLSDLLAKRFEKRARIRFFETLRRGVSFTEPPEGMPLHQKCLMKGYMKDGKPTLARLIPGSYLVLRKLVAELKEKDPVIFLYDDFSPHFQVLSLLLKEAEIPYLTFSGHFYRPDAVIIGKDTVDFGSVYRDKNLRETLLKKKCPDKNIGKTFNLPKIADNPTIHIETPPDKVTGKNLRKIRNRPMLCRQLIAMLNARRPHPEVVIHNNRSDGNPWEEDTRFQQWSDKLASRCVADGKEPDKNAIVLTWSTERFFHHIKRGIPAIVLTRSLSGSLFNQRGSIEEVIESYRSAHLKELCLFINEFMTFSEEKNHLWKKLPFMISCK